MQTEFKKAPVESCQVFQRGPPDVHAGGTSSSLPPYLLLFPFFFCLFRCGTPPLTQTKTLLQKQNKKSFVEEAICVCHGRKKKEFGRRTWFVNPSPQKRRRWCRRRRRTRNRVCWSLSSVVLARRSFRKQMDRRRRRSSSSSRRRRRSKRRKEKVSSVREKPDLSCCCCRFSLQRRGSTAITHARTTYKTVTTTMRSTCKTTRWACAVTAGWKERANDWVLHLLKKLWKDCKSWMRRHDNLASAQKKPHQQQQEPLLLMKKSLISMLIKATTELATSYIHVKKICVCVCVCVCVFLFLSHSLSLSVSLSIFCFCFFASLNAPLFLLMFKLPLFVRVSSSNKPQQTTESD